MCIETLKCLCEPHEDIESKDIVPLILNLSSRRRYVVSYTPHPFYSLYTLNRRLGGLRNGKDTFEMYRIGIDKFSKNLGATSKFCI